MDEMLNNDVGQEVQPTTTEQPFRVFKTQKEFDDFSSHLIKKAEDKALKNATVTDGQATFNAKEYEAKYRKDLEAKIRADIERQAQMTEAERLADERAKMQETFKQERIEINKDKARNLLATAGFEEDEMEVYLDFVTDDREVSLGKIMRVCESRKNTKAKLQRQWQAELQASNPSINIGSQDGNSLQAQYDNAKAMGNLALMSSITRKASQAGIPLRT
jgi:hypothetical protein